MLSKCSLIVAEVGRIGISGGSSWSDSGRSDVEAGEGGLGGEGSNANGVGSG